MPTAPRFASIASAEGAVSAGAARQLDTLWRRAMAGQGGVVHEYWYRIISGEAHPLGNVAIIGVNDEPEIALEAVRPLAGITLPSAALFTDGASGVTAEALAALGFVAHGAMPVMAVDLPVLAPTQLPDGYTLERIGTDEASEWTDVLAAGYGLPRGLARMLSPEALDADMADDAELQFFAVRHDDRIVATSMMFLADGLAGIYCVATLEEARRKGLGAHATAAPLRLAQDLGYGVGVLQSSEAGYPVYVGLGFRDVAAIPIFIRMPG